MCIVSLNFVSPVVYFTWYCVFQVGMSLHCRVTRINMERFQVDLTCKTSDLVDKDSKFRYFTKHQPININVIMNCDKSPDVMQANISIEQLVFP